MQIDYGKSLLPLPDRYAPFPYNASFEMTADEIRAKAGELKRLAGERGLEWSASGAAAWEMYWLRKKRC